MNGNAVNVSLTRLREYERERKRNYFILFEIILFVLIIGLLLFTLGGGVNVYRNISNRHWEDEQSRTGLTLIANSVHITDTIDAVGVGNGPEGQALVLTEVFTTGSYETRIYLYNGNIVEEYAVAGTPYTPTRATPLVESSTFSFSYADGLLSINTDHGVQQVMLHSVRKAGTGNVAAVEEGAAAGEPVEDAGEAASADAPAAEGDAEAAEPAAEGDVEAAAEPAAEGDTEAAAEDNAEAAAEQPAEETEPTDEGGEA